MIMLFLATVITVQNNPAFRDCNDCPDVRVIPAGDFIRADSPENWTRGRGPFGSAHIVTIAQPFAIGVTEVTFEEWDLCVSEGGCAYRPDDEGFGRGNRPVIHVSLADTKEYLAWLSAKTGLEYRLPSEAEWEYAARGGTDARFLHADSADDAAFCEYANHADVESELNSRNTSCSDGYPDSTAPAASYPANNFGLHDMIGNVWEWTSDCWHDPHWEDRGAWDTSYPAWAPKDGAAY